MSQSGLNIGEEAASFLTDIIPIFNRIIFSSGILESLTDQVRAGKQPLNVARELQSEMDMLIDTDNHLEHIEKYIMAQIKGATVNPPIPRF